MLKVFEKSTLLQVVIILATTALLWVPDIIAPVPMSAPNGFAPLYSLVYSIGLSSTVAIATAIVLILLGGLSLNLLLANIGLVSQNSLLPTLLYILFMSAGASTLTPQLIVNVLVVILVNLLMLRSTHLTIPTDKIFGAAVVIGICTLFYLPALALILTYIFVAVSYRLYRWRDWIIFLLGILAPYLPVWAILFFNDSLAESFSSMADTLSTLHFSLPTPHSLSVIANTALTILFVTSLLTLWSRLSEHTIVWKKNAITVMLITVAALVMIPFTGSIPFNLQFLAVPCALSASLWFAAGSHRLNRSQRKWRSRLYDLLFLITLIAALLC